MIQIKWEIKSFDQLTKDELYDILKLRVDVFVVEQSCPYPEIDGRDNHVKTLHLFGKNQENELVAYLRILPPGLSFSQVSIGRVAVALKSRRQGISTVMVKKSLEHIGICWPGSDIKIGAQRYLKEFYEALGFEAASQSYLEDGIPHIDMIRPCAQEC